MSDHDFLITFHINFLSGMNSFQDDEDLLQAGYDVHQEVLHTILYDGF